MATTAANLSLCNPKSISKYLETSFINPKQTVAFPALLRNRSWNGVITSSSRAFRTMATPQSLSDQIAESVKAAEETCAEDATSRECAAAWDEVEEVSAAASHLRDRNKKVDPLEEYCKDNPETDECRTYED